jgi:hypothetical protein
MGQFQVKVSGKDVSLFDRQGRVRASFADTHTKFNSSSIDLGVTDPARITATNEQMNPMGRHIASTIVSPQPTWTPVIPAVNIAMTMILAIVAIANQLEDETNSKASRNSLLGKPVYRENYQIINFEDFLPESVTNG